MRMSRGGVHRAKYTDARHAAKGSRPRRSRCKTSGVPVARLAWITVTAICVVAALLLLVNGYDGYSAVLLLVGLSAAVNLLP